MISNAEIAAQLEQVYGQLCDLRGELPKHPKLGLVDQGFDLVQAQFRSLVQALREPEMEISR